MKAGSSPSWFDDDPDYLDALANLPIDATSPSSAQSGDLGEGTSKPLAPDSPSSRTLKRALPYNDSQDSPRMSVGNDEVDPDIYGPSKFGGFGEYMARKRRKLQIQNAEILNGSQGLRPQVFKGIGIYINGRTEPPLQELRTMIVEHGGVFHAYLDRKSLVTHIVATELTPNKVKEYQHMKVVVPEWITDSVRQGALQPWRDYILRLGSREQVDGPLTSRGVQKQGILEFGSPTKAASGDQRTSVADTLEPPDSDGKAFSTFSDQESEHEVVNDDAAEIKNPSYALHKSNIYASKLMEDPKWRLENTAAGPDFVENYFKQSRLHHLSTWKSELKLLVKHARDKPTTASSVLPTSEEVHNSDDTSMRGAEIWGKARMPGLKPKSPPASKEARKAVSSPSYSRVIMHCDFDSFFVAAGLVDRPELRGKPVVVCHSNTPDLTRVSSTSEVASASYEAREFGVKNGMSLGQAKRLCPDVQPIPYEFRRYKEFSLSLYRVLLSFAEDIEVVSVDEALIDVTSQVQRRRQELGEDERSSDVAKDFADEIRSRIREVTRCEVSVGIGSSVLLAKLANRKAKPAGSFHLRDEDANSHLDLLPIDRLPGFASSAKQKIVAKWNVNTCGGVRKLGNVEVLQRVLGPGTGEKLWKYVRGIDDRDLSSGEPRKSLSAAVKYGVRCQTNEEVKSFLYSLAREVGRRLEAESYLGQSLTLEIMIRNPDAPIEAPKFLGHGVCHKYNYTTPIHGPDGHPTSDASIIGAAAWKLYLGHHGADTTDLRGVGYAVHGLETEKEVANTKQRKIAFPKQANELQKSHPQFLLSMHPPPRITVVDLTDNHSADGQEDVRSATPSRDDLPAVASSERAGSKANVKFITKQLAPPRSKLSSSTKFSIFKKRESTPLSISDVELWDLEIDPSTFHALPPDIQREQLSHQRMLYRNSSRDSRSRSRSRSTSVVPPKPSALVARELIAPSLKKAKTTEEIQDLVSDWVDRFCDVGPEPEATASFQEFLLKCISDEAGGSLGLEKVSSVMKWWLHLCRAKCGCEKPGYDVGTPPPPGVQWWSAFHQVCGRLNEVISSKYGGKLSLR